VLVEVLTSSLSMIDSHPIALFMEKQGYKVYAKAVNTVFFFSEKYLNSFSA